MFINICGTRRSSTGCACTGSAIKEAVTGGWSVGRALSECLKELVVLGDTERCGGEDVIGCV